jgi:hypothetical protein
MDHGSDLYCKEAKRQAARVDPRSGEGSMTVSLKCYGQVRMLLKPIEFRRTDNQVVYRFVPDGERNGKSQWRRIDLDLWCVYLDAIGWVVVDASDTQLSWPVDRALAFNEAPPTGLWVSQKGDRSYTYELVYVS